MKKIPGVILYFEMRGQLNQLNDKDVRKLVYAMLNYAEFGETPDFMNDSDDAGRALRVAWSSQQPKIDNNIEKYEERRRKNKEAAEKRWKKQQETESEPEPEGADIIEDFNDFLEVYPRKTDFNAAYKKYQSMIKKGFSPEELISAAKAYARECEENHTEERYIKSAKNFLSDSMPFFDYIPKKKPPDMISDDDLFASI